MVKKIIIKFQIEGTHKWETCPIKEVDFLKNEHRHIFHIEVSKEVSHNDRDIEIIQLKRKLIKHFGNQPVQFNNQSCEDIAEKLMNEFNLDSVQVLEDNENGALISKK